MFYQCDWGNRTGTVFSPAQQAKATFIFSKLTLAQICFNLSRLSTEDKPHLFKAHGLGTQLCTVVARETLTASAPPALAPQIKCSNLFKLHLHFNTLATAIQEARDGPWAGFFIFWLLRCALSPKPLLVVYATVMFSLLLLLLILLL